MKNYTYILGFVSAVMLIVLTSGGKMENRYDESAYGEEISRLSDYVQLVSFVPLEDLSDNHDYGDDRIIYPSVSIDTGSVRSNFMVSEFTKYDVDASIKTINKIKNIHIPQLERVRDRIKKPIIIRSASRTYEHEKKMGRSGNSQHVYKKGDGAVDISLAEYSTDNLNKLEKAIIEETDYNRVSRYHSYLHLDYAPNRFGGRGYYRNTKQGWIYLGEIQ